MPEWTAHLRERLAKVSLSPERESEIIEELSQHLDQRYEELRRTGSNDAEAKKLALEELTDSGALAQHMSSLRQAHNPPRVAPGAPAGSLLGGMGQDLRYALRTLRMQPGFALTAILTLALGIGANSAIFALVDATLLRPLPFPEPDRLVMMFEKTEQGEGAVAPLNMLDWRSRSHSFEAIGAYVPNVGGMVMAGADGTAETVPRQWVTSGIFDALGIKAIVGRTFHPSDDTKREALVVFSEAFWRARYAGDPSIVGQSVRLDGAPFFIVGVVPNETQLIGRSSMWALRSIPPIPQLRTQYVLNVIGRLKPGSTIEDAQSDMEAVAGGLAREFPATNTGRSATLQPLHNVMIGSDLRLTSMLFLAVVGFVLLICCANVANLLLARATTRVRELAVRMTLGASRPRIIRQLLTESLVLSAIGGLLGAGVAWAILRAAPAVVPQDLLPPSVALGFDVRVAAFCAVSALLIGLVFGLAPAWKTPGVSWTQAMGSSSRSSTSNRGRLRGLLVVAEVATAVVLLYGSGLLLRTLIAVDNVDRGYRGDQVLTMMVDPLGDKYPTPDALLRFYDSIEQEIRVLPGVRNVAWSSSLPLQQTGEEPVAFEIAGDQPRTENERPAAEYKLVSPEYFSALDVPVLQGRSFTAIDTATSIPVCVVSEAFVRRYAQGRTPIGMRVGFPRAGVNPTPMREIVGVVRQVKTTPTEMQEPVQIYVPTAQRVSDDMYLVIRVSSEDAGVLAPAARAAIARLDREQLVSVRDAMTVKDIAREATSRQRFRAVLVTTLAGLALVLAMVGVFGILAYSVQQRVREIGVRRAVGATTSDVALLIVGNAGRWMAAGVAIGLALSAALGRLVAALLVGVEPLDAITFGAVILVLLLAAVLAASVPAWRAVRVDPAIALRTD